VSLRRRKGDLHKIPAERFVSRSIAVTGRRRELGRAAAEALAAAGRKVIGIVRHALFECVNFVAF
jgi:NAD(P)-dependent dehydrogenase (short-subunit alcohol dehydrogenase family)